MIRNLFFGLVLVNLAFAAWTAWYAEPQQASAGKRETGVPIRLVGEGLDEDDAGLAANGRGGATAERSGTGVGRAPFESPPAEQGATPAAPRAGGAAAAEGAVSAAPDAGERCVSIGPFEDAEDTEAAATALQAAGFVTAQRDAEGEIWVGFWVHLDAIPTREEANAMLAQLRDNGVPDAYLIPGEEDGDIISLGVFNNMTRAGRLDEQVRRIGLVPTILERTRPGTVQWLDISVDGGRDVDLGALGIGQARVGQQPCDVAG